MKSLLALSNEINTNTGQSNRDFSDLSAFGAQAVQAWMAGLTVCK